MCCRYFLGHVTCQNLPCQGLCKVHWLQAIVFHCLHCFTLFTRTTKEDVEDASGGEGEQERWFGEKGRHESGEMESEVNPATSIYADKPGSKLD